MNYPNLELLEYQIRTKNRLNLPIFKAEMFCQTWTNTNGGMESFAGCDAFVDEYTTVFHECTTDTYYVCFGNRYAYSVLNPNEQFYEDLKNKDIKGLYTSKKFYK